MYDLGVTEEYRRSVDSRELRPAQTPILDDQGLLPFAAKDDGFVLTACLHDIIHLQVHKDDRWCLGLRITRSDGSVRVLGRWDPDMAVISTIYQKACDGPLTGLAFQLEHAGSQNEPRTRMRDVIPTTSISKDYPPDGGLLFTRYFLCPGDRQVSYVPPLFTSVLTTPT